MIIKQAFELPDGIERLALLAEQEGFNFLRRLVNDFESHKNRFNNPGEALFVVHVDQKLVGIGGVNIDPYTEESGVGRIRRLYIHPNQRQSGVGQALVSAIESYSRSHFIQLRLFTDTESAAKFYEHVGYIRTSETPKVSHIKRLR